MLGYVCPGGGGGVSAPVHAGICLPRGMSAPVHAGICLPGGCLSQCMLGYVCPGECLPAWGVSAPVHAGICLPRGVSVPVHAGIHPTPMNRMTDRCKNTANMRTQNEIENSEGCSKLSDASGA